MFPYLRSLVVALIALTTLLVAAWQHSRTQPEKGVAQLAGISTSPRFWKGNLHTHSLWSDGDDFPEMISDWYKQHGYDFLALTDHNILADGEKWIDTVAKTGTRAEALRKYLARFGSAWVEQRKLDGKQQVRLKPLAEYRSLLEEPGKFLLIPAEEITHKFAKSPVHLNGINLRDVVKPVDGEEVAGTIKANLRVAAEQAKKSGWRSVTFLNHPNFGWGVKAEDMVLAEELRYFEMYNGHPGVKNYGDEQHAGTEKMWDIANALRLGKLGMPILYGLATDDAHRYHEWGVGKVNPGRGWIQVRAPYLTAEAMVRGIEAGDFYCSTGVVLMDVRQDKDRLSLTIADQPGVAYRTQFIVTFKDAPLDSEPRLDDKGKPLAVTRVYSPEIGKVVAEVAGSAPSYAFTGKELYVRAKVISTKPHPNPFEKGDLEMAWTQPVVP